MGGPEPARSRGGLLVLLAAVAAAGVLLVQAPVGGRPARSPARTVDAVWPHARRGEVPASLPDGAAYSPAYFLDERASVGVSPDPRGGAVRLVVRATDGGVRVLRRLPLAGGPQFAGFTRAGGDLLWAESVSAGHGGAVRTELWRAELASGGAPRRITGDAGNAVFSNSEYDLVVNSGRLYWAAAAPGREEVTEVRSVPLGGGPVDVRTEPGGWVLSGWPWLVSAGSRASGPARMRNLDTGRVVTVAAAGESVTCGPTWCRVLVPGGDGLPRSELMRPDGSGRRRVADDGATASIVDVAVLDRFEVLSGESSTLASAIGGQRLYVYDLRSGQLTTAAEAAGRVFYRGGVLWWSTGQGESGGWRTLDLRSV